MLNNLAAFAKSKSRLNLVRIVVQFKIESQLINIYRSCFSDVITYLVSLREVSDHNLD